VVAAIGGGSVIDGAEVTANAVLACAALLARSSTPTCRRCDPGRPVTSRLRR
jgi:hypothetical protein